MCMCGWVSVMDYISWLGVMPIRYPGNLTGMKFRGLRLVMPVRFPGPHISYFCEDIRFADCSGYN